jgi:hypothetical protein
LFTGLAASFEENPEQTTTIDKASTAKSYLASKIQVHSCLISSAISSQTFSAPTPVKSGSPLMEGMVTPGGAFAFAISMSKFATFEGISAILHWLQVYFPAKPLFFIASLSRLVTTVEVATAVPQASKIRFIENLLTILALHKDFLKTGILGNVLDFYLFRCAE